MSGLVRVASSDLTSLTTHSLIVSSVTDVGSWRSILCPSLEVVLYMCALPGAVFAAARVESVRRMSVRGLVRLIMSDVTSFTTHSLMGGITGRGSFLSFYVLVS